MSWSTGKFVRGRIHPSPIGHHKLGCIRVRLPTAPDGTPGVLAQVTYPAEETGTLEGAESFKSVRSEVAAAFCKSNGLPAVVGKFLVGGRPQADPSSPPKQSESGWPLLIFSSGLFGCCEMYSQLCRELASMGTIVVALEHEDGSGIHAVCGKTGERIEYKKPPEGATIVEFRRPFLEHRSKEIRQALATLRAFARSGQASGSTTEAYTQVNPALAAVLGQGNTSQLLLVGHSFGAAGMLFHLAQTSPEERSQILGAIIADPWSAPLGPEVMEKDLGLPFTLIISEKWSRGDLSEEGVASKKLVASSSGNCLAAMEVLGSSHQWISDVNLWGPTWLLKKFGVVGNGDIEKIHRATGSFLQLSLEALLDPTKRAGLSGRVVAGGESVLASLEMV